MHYGPAINHALHALLAAEPRLVLLGEDLADPYGGAFKITRGLSTAFPDRVLSTPISEAAITGVAGGLALAGFRPVVEFMFGDFTGLAFDQILNHLTKYAAMYHGQVSCPVILRTPMGGGRAYGPTHSQCLEKYFLGVPGLNVAAVSLFHPPAEIWAALLRQDGPVLLVEHKGLYGQDTRFPEAGRCGLFEAETAPGPGGLSTVCLRPVPRADCRLTLLAYGATAASAADVAAQLAVERELFVEVVVPASMYPFDYDTLTAAVAATGRLLVCEEGTAGGTWGDGIAAELTRRLWGRLRAPVATLAADRATIPAAAARERAMLPGPDRLRNEILDILR